MARAVSKSRMAIFATALLVSGFLGFWCFVARGGVLEYENVFQYKLELNEKTKVPEKISGLCGRSMYCVQEITTKTNQATVVVLVKIGFCKKGQSGSFSYPLKLGDDIQELRFGEKETLLWSRSRGAVK
jgi:hypothetical protein